ncbi:hypothetical protein [Streptomyces atratus]|uniref:hypothetical protein n=1 Tax=Streptomyces atratus TaxID=1893 RepID=UPI003409ABD7
MNTAPGGPDRPAAGAVAMLRVTDGRTLRPTGIPAGHRRGMLTMRIHLARADTTVDATDMRALLVGDVLARALEARGVQVFHTLAGPALPREPAVRLRHAMDGLGIHPPTGESTGTGDRADLHVSAAALRATTTGLWLQVGRVRQDAPPLQLVRAESADGVDPLAVRLTLLAFPYRRPIGLTSDLVSDAGRRLAAWRRQVATWADSPSKPVPPDIVTRADAALADDLGTPGMLDLLRHVETADTIADGAKFETFALLDRVLGLELTREIGRV